MSLEEALFAYSVSVVIVLVALVVLLIGVYLASEDE